jgi:hypothetical protein
MAHGEVCYLQIPARDPMASAAFYEQVFGWRVERPYPSFEAPGIIGQWVDDRPPSADAGILAWISVDRIADALVRVRAAGGETLEEPYADGPNRLLATVRDPAGNAVGLVEHGVSGR